MKLNTTSLTVCVWCAVCNNVSFSQQLLHVILYRTLLIMLLCW